MEPKISIVIPVYNGANYLKEAIDSALKQTYNNFEIIVVNDGSTDNGLTEKIAKSYGNRIRYFSKENGGVASALNYAIERMEGEYFSWLSHDDVYYPQKLELQMKALHEKQNMLAPLYGNWDILRMPENKVYPSAPNYCFSEEQMEQGIFPVLFGLVNGCTVLIHKSHFERVGMFEESLETAQDVDMWFRIFRNQQVVYVKDPLIMYRYHEQQGSNTILAFHDNCQSIYKKMVESLSEKEIKCIFGGKYKLYADMLTLAETRKWEKCLKEWLRTFHKIPSAGEEYPRVNNQNIVLYCAGKNGRYLKRELGFRNVQVAFFSDGNPNLWNQIIDGVKCIPPEMIELDSIVIVTKDYPEKIVAMLQKKGYSNVLSYKDIAHQLFCSVPIKQLVLEEYECN